MSTIWLVGPTTVEGRASGTLKVQSFPTRPKRGTEPYYIGWQQPPDETSEYWRTLITGPFIETIHLGDSQRCGPETVKLLNLAYTAGIRNQVSSTSENLGRVYSSVPPIASGESC